MRKLERLGPSPDPRQAQQVISRFTRAEKRAYDDYLAVDARPGRAARGAEPRRRAASSSACSGRKPKPTRRVGTPKKAGKRRR